MAQNGDSENVLNDFFNDFFGGVGDALGDSTRSLANKITTRVNQTLTNVADVPQDRIQQTGQEPASTNKFLNMFNDNKVTMFTVFGGVLGGLLLGKFVFKGSRF